MGRRPKTEEAHDLSGTKAHIAPEKDTAVVAGRVQYRRHLDAPSKHELKHVVALMEEIGTGTRGDEPPATIYAVTMARWIECKAAITRDGLLVEVEVLDSNGAAHVVRRLHPLLKIAQDCERQILALARTLGLTPVDRLKVVPAPPDFKPPTMADLHPEWAGGVARPKVVPALCPVPPLDEGESE